MYCSFASYVMHDFGPGPLAWSVAYYTSRRTCHLECVVVTLNVPPILKSSKCFSGHKPDLQSCSTRGIWLLKKVARLQAIAKHREPCGMSLTLTLTLACMQQPSTGSRAACRALREDKPYIYCYSSNLFSL